MVATGIITELSISGAVVATVLRCPSLARVQVQIRSARGRRSPPLAAIAVRRTTRGLALEWLELAALDVLLLVRPPAAPAATAAAADSATPPSHAPAA